MHKILIDARELRTSSGRYVERLINYLQQVDKTNIYNILLKPSDIEDWNSINPNFSKLACSSKEFSFSEQTSLLKQVNSLNADLIHFTFPQQPIWYKGKTITTIHDLTTLRFVNPDKNIAVFKFKQMVFKYVIKRSVKKSVYVITPSQFVRDDIVKFAGIDPNKVVVTYEGADLIIDNAMPVLELEGKRFIMYLGRPTPHKNLDRLIEAFILLKADHPDLLLVLAGKKDANYKRIEERVNKRGIDNILFTDFVSEGQLKWLYQNCSAYVFPSLSEGFGLPGLEAMVHGAPVVSSNGTCLPEIYGDAAKYFDPTNIQAMADAISEVLTNQELRNELIEKGKVQASKYSWEAMAKQTLEVYNNALNKT